MATENPLHKKLQSELKNYQTVQKKYVKYVKQRALLESQLFENKSVLLELNLLGSQNNVYKMQGPVLIKQDLAESRLNVEKRIEFINKEITSLKQSFDDVETEMIEHREVLLDLQKQCESLEASKTDQTK